MNRFLMLAAVVAGLSVTGLSGAATAGYGPTRAGYSSWGSNSGFGNYGYNSRNCWSGYRNQVPMTFHTPRPYAYGSSYGYGNIFGSYAGRGCNW